MPIKHVSTSQPAVYRNAITVPPGTYNYWSTNPVNNARNYDEYVSFLMGVAVLDNPASPTHYEIHVMSLLQYRYWPSWKVGSMVFNALNGTFKGWDTRQSQYTIKYVSTGPDGMIWANNNNFTLARLNRDTMTFSNQHNLLNYYGQNVGSNWTSSAPICVDYTNDRTITKLNRDKGYQVSICEESTGNALYQVDACGAIIDVFMADDRRAYLVSNTGVITVIDYVTNQKLGALHIETTPYQRRWSWDKTLKRIITCTLTPDDMPEGDCTIKLEAYYPIPLPAGLTPPIPLGIVRKDKRTPIYTRVYGATGEGVAGNQVTFSLSNTPGAGTIGPARVATDRNGTLRTYFTGTLAGDNIITGETEV